MTVSSAYTTSCKRSCRSLVSSKKRTGPKTNSCGTPWIGNSLLGILKLLVKEIMLDEGSTHDWNGLMVVGFSLQEKH